MKSILETPKKRMNLAPGKLHTEKLMSGSYLVYSRPVAAKGGSELPGNWSVRLYNSETRKQKTSTLGTADDFSTADGLLIFSYLQAKEKADSRLRELSRAFEMGITGRKILTNKTGYTVANAMQDYMDYLINDGKRSIRTVKPLAEAHIIPYLGDIVVNRLTKEKVEEWRTMLSKQPKRKIIKAPGCKTRMEYCEYPTDLDGIRKRKDTANHMLNMLKIALNRALKYGKVDQPKPGGWADAAFFEGTKGVRLRFLNVEEQKRFIASIDDQDFKNLVIAGLKTGARYQELAKMKVMDFMEDNGSVYFGVHGKVKGRQRYVFLDEEGVSFFKELVKGKGSDDIIFTRKTYRDFVSRDRGNDNIWVDTDQCYYMKKASIVGKFDPPITFHVLRHTFASMLVQKGVPLQVVANQMGHSTIAMVQKHYGHLCPTVIQRYITENMPSILS